MSSDIRDPEVQEQIDMMFNFFMELVERLKAYPDTWAYVTIHSRYNSQTNEFEFDQIQGGHKNQLDA